MLEYSIIAIGAGIFLLITGFKSWHLKRIIENTPTSKIRSIAMGLVEIYGTVTKPHDKFLKSPFTNKDCVYYKYSVEKLQHTDKGKRWITLTSGENNTPFYLKDTTGKVLIQPTGATVDIPPNYKKETITINALEPSIKTFCAKNNLALTTFFGFGRTLKFTETTLKPDDKTYILGTADDNPYHKEATAHQGVDDIMIHKGKHRIFYISNQPEKNILQSLAFKSYGCVYGGAALTLAALTYFLWTINST